MDFASAAAGRHMDDLPDEVFAKILNLVPIKQVIRCAIVSKRWDAACRYIIRTRESLVIGNHTGYRPHSSKKGGWNWNQERPSYQMDGITLKNDQLISAMMISLNQMVELRRLRVAQFRTRLEDIIPFIRNFAEQLTMLEVCFAVSMIGADAFPHLTRLRCGEFDANSLAAFPKLAELIVDKLTKNRNMRLPSLKKLLIIEPQHRRGARMVRDFIRANAGNLTILQMIGIPLQLDMAVVFPNLIQLDCRKLDVIAGCSFPALTHLSVGTVTAEFLSSLPADQMLSLDVDFDREIDYVVSAISQMKNLKCLKLTESGWGMDEGVWSEARGTFSSIFDNMHHLEKVKLSAHYCRIEHDDRMVATLVNQNPKLSRVSFDQIRLTNAALTSLAQLQHLTNVQIYRSLNVTTSGALTLLRGSSRNVIRTLSVRSDEVDGDQVSREIGHDRDPWNQMHSGRQRHSEGYGRVMHSGG